jgi:hypothetical protein
VPAGCLQILIPHFPGSQDSGPVQCVGPLLAYEGAETALTLEVVDPSDVLLVHAANFTRMTFVDGDGPPMTLSGDALVVSNTRFEAVPSGAQYESAVVEREMAGMTVWLALVSSYRAGSLELSWPGRAASDVHDSRPCREEVLAKCMITTVPVDDVDILRLVVLIALIMFGLSSAFDAVAMVYRIVRTCQSGPPHSHETVLSSARY